jgi:hypothetical protein
MVDKRERFAAATGKNPELADKLDRILTGPDDRAFILCTYRECTHNAKGECMIYTVLDVPRMKPGVPCDSYNTESHGSGGNMDEAGE